MTDDPQGIVLALFAAFCRIGGCILVLPGFSTARVPVIFGRAAGRPDERITVMPLGEADAERADMATCVIIGSPETRIIARDGRPDLVYTPRSFGESH